MPDVDTLRFIRRCLVAVVFAISAAGQQPGKVPDFEVASVRPANPDGAESLYTDRSAGLHVTNFSLRAMIAFAYDIRDFQIAGSPGWVGDERYDITAKAECCGSLADGQGRTADEQLRERIRALLASRFGLAAHFEARDQQTYRLVVANKGPKLKVAVPGDQYGFRGGRGGRNQGFAVTTAMLANELARIIGRPVLDKTGLTEKYGYILQWTPDNAPPSDSSGPTIFTALREQLGLQLESLHAPVDTLVIDHVERPLPN